MLLDEDLVVLLSPLHTVPVPLAGVLMLLMLVVSVKLYKELDRLHAEGADKRGSAARRLRSIFLSSRNWA